MLKISGDGNLNNTLILKDGVPINNVQNVLISISPKKYFASIDGDIDQIDSIMLFGIYNLVGMKDFANTKLFFGEEWLRCVQSVVIRLSRNKPPRMTIKTLLVPNLVEKNNG